MFNFLNIFKSKEDKVADTKRDVLLQISRLKGDFPRRYKEQRDQLYKIRDKMEGEFPDQLSIIADEYPLIMTDFDNTWKRIREFVDKLEDITMRLGNDDDEAVLAELSVAQQNPLPDLSNEDPSYQIAINNLGKKLAILRAGCCEACLELARRS